MTDEEIQKIIDEMFWDTPECNVTKHDRYHDRFCTECGYPSEEEVIKAICKRVLKDMAQKRGLL